MKTTTLNKIRAHSPCDSGWAKLLQYLGKTAADDEPLSFITILESNGLNDALWCCRAAPEYDREWRLYAVFCARKVQCLMTDPRSITVIDVAERHANGLATDAELVAAWDAARDVALAATLAAPPAAVRAAVWAARVAAGMVLKAAWAAWDTAWIARAAARAARGVPGTARGVPGAAGTTWDAADEAELAVQIIKFREIISGETI